MTEPLNCHLLEWDSRFFGYPVARLYNRRVDAGLLAEVFGWCQAHTVRCLYYLAPAEDTPSLLAAQAAGMQFVDVRLTMAREIGPGQSWPLQEAVSPATAADRATLLTFAPHLARVSRFSTDPRFGAAAAVKLYEVWLQKESDAILVTRTSEGVRGCIMCDVEQGGDGVIDLLVVAPEHQGQSLGLALCTAALNWFSERGCARARVVTQGHSVASQRAYQRAGFLTHAVEIWFHKWFDTQSK